MTILVATTIGPYKMEQDRGYWSTWAENAPAISRSVAAPVRYFAALETDARGRSVYEPLLTGPARIDAWWFSIDDNAAEITSDNRLYRICTGRNLITEYAIRDLSVTHILFVDSDTRIPDDALPRLLEVGYPIIGGKIPTYSHLDGPQANHGIDGADIRVHFNTAGFLLVERQLFSRLRWRTDIDLRLTDDPCYHADASELGYPTWVRHDVIGRHYPEQLPAVEHRGHDLKVYR